MLQAFKAAGPACLKEEGVCRDGRAPLEAKPAGQWRGGRVEVGWGGQGRGSTKGKLRGNRSQTSATGRALRAGKLYDCTAKLTDPNQHFPEEA